MSRLGLLFQSRAFVRFQERAEWQVRLNFPCSLLQIHPLHDGTAITTSSPPPQFSQFSNEDITTNSIQYPFPSSQLEEAARLTYAYFRLPAKLEFLDHGMACCPSYHDSYPTSNSKFAMRKIRRNSILERSVEAILYTDHSSSVPQDPPC